MKHQRFLFPAMSLAMVFALSACGKQESPAPAAPPAAAPAAPATEEAASQPRASLGDPSTPLEKYQRLDSGKQIVMAYLALSPGPRDYDQVAKLLFPAYAKENDGFKRSDMLKTLKPQIDADAEKAKSNRYLVMNLEEIAQVMFAGYDFNEKGFLPFTLNLAINGLHYYENTKAYKLSLQHSPKFAWLRPADEQKARAIESFRSENPNAKLTMEIYLFMEEVDPDDTIVKANIMKIRLLDQKGNLLLEQ